MTETSFKEAPLSTEEVTIKRLKVERTRLKSKVTNLCKKLIELIEDNVATKSDLHTIESCMSEFSDAHDEYCCLIECYDHLGQYAVVNSLGLREYYDGVSKVYREAKAQFHNYMTSREVSSLKQKINVQSARLESVCAQLEDMLSSSDNDAVTLASFCQEMEHLSDQLLNMMSDVSSIDTACDLQKSVTALVVRADEAKRKCYVKRKTDVVIPSSTLPKACMTSYHPEFKFSVDVDSKVACSDSNNFSSISNENLTSKGTDNNGVPSTSEVLPSVTSPNFQCQISHGDVFLKKTPLPEFSGHRKDWPEFKSVWRELAESTISSRSVLAYELKRSLKGKAKEWVQNIYITKPEAYEIMWKRLCDFYDDVSACVQSALDGLFKLKPVRDDDYRGLVHLVDSVESAYSQLEELTQVDVLSMRDIDRIAELLPSSLRMLWVRQYHQLDNQTKLKPFSNFMNFLCTERAAVARLAENKKTSTQSNLVHRNSDKLKNDSKGLSTCAVHKDIKVKHTTADCRDFQKLSLDDKYQALKNVHACFNCFGLHRRDKCRSQVPCKVCGKHGHHYLLCKRSHSPATTVETSECNQVEPHGSTAVTGKASSVSSNLARDPEAVSLYAIHDVFVTNSGKMATIFCDNGSNTSYITHRAADRLRAKNMGSYTLGVTTMGNIETEYDSRLYEVSIRTTTGKIVKITAFGMNEITGPVSRLDENCLSELFPGYDVSLLQRRSSTVDILLGCDHFGLHPKKELHSAGENLSIMQGDLGVCLQGYHSELRENTRLSTHMIKTLHGYKMKADCNFLRAQTHPEFEPSQVRVTEMTYASTMFCKSSDFSFAVGEDLVTETNPRCGSCKCGKCPNVGHSYSFKEEQELLMIRENLKYDEMRRCWVTSYPWIIDPASLPDNYHVALSTLRSTEKTLAKDPVWAEKYKMQIQDMLDRQVARKLTSTELQTWRGPVFYISHLAVHNPSSNSTPVHIVFNSSQLCNGVSLNSALAKGPDSYLNHLMGLLLRWREQCVAFVGDITKMFNSVHMEMNEQHCHRFLWRDLNSTKDPDIYVMTRVNMGDRPAPAISTEALYKTAERFRKDSPAAAEVLRRSSYVDDLIDSVPDFSSALKLTAEVEDMLNKGGFCIKCWQFTGESGARKSSLQAIETSLLKGDDSSTRVLGVTWNPIEDVIMYVVNLNFSKKKKGIHTGPNLKLENVPDCIPHVLTRRLVLQQVMSIFDPLGILCPFTLQAKIHLRETWTTKLGWDDALPPDLRNKWILFFKTLFQMQDLKFPRCLQPANVKGQPWLILMSDGSDLAYGFVAYIRWELQDGSYWCRLIYAKCRIAPVNKLSTPQMELNAAVLSKRGRKVIEAEMRFKFERIIHIVDSETVLCMINKTSTRFRVYEGVRIGEIQAATQGNMKDWAWISGNLNTADWLTRGRAPKELDQDSDWWNGPPFLSQNVSEWGLKFDVSRAAELPGEKKPSSVTASVNASCAVSQLSSIIDYKRYSSVSKVYWVIARLLGICRLKSFKGGNTVYITPSLLREAENLVVRDVQSTMEAELEKTSKNGATGGKYGALKPLKNDSGLWVVGSRVAHLNPMTPDSSPQKLLSYDHPVTKLIMRNAHENGHYGRNGTLAKFRQTYWTPNGSKLAWQAKNQCQKCKLRDCKLMEQNMGQLPEDRLKPSPPFCYTMVDFFGPHLVRGEVQKRMSGKAYGVLFTDLVMRAVHIEAVFSYDTSAFIMSLIRFAAVRGWPSVIYSDSGTQFVAAGSELKQVWKNVDKTALVKKSTENGLKWVFGPADSPWQQGAVESMVKAAKKAISFSVNNQRLSPSEFMTLCAEVSNTLNERPIGLLPGDDSDISVLTPNSLLLGRSTAKNPGGWQHLSASLSNRCHLVQQISDLFWAKWVELCAPFLIVQRKWHRAGRNLQVGDVVLILDRNTLRGEYRLGLVQKVYPGSDGKVRKVQLSYKNYKVGEKLFVYSGVKDILVTRAVQRLALLVPVNNF